MNGTDAGTRVTPSEPSFSVGVLPQHDDTSIVVVAGEIDLATSPALRDVLLDVEQCPGPVVVVDLRGVTFLDSSGLNALVSARNALVARHGRMRLECGPGPVPLVLHASGLDQVFDVTIARES
jgi:anti-anti-sigma factor